MIIEAWAKHRSWFYSAGIAVLITMWVLTGTLGGDDTGAAGSETVATSILAPRSKVRVRTQSAEEVVRTIVVNGETSATARPGWRRRRLRSGSAKWNTKVA